MATCKLMKMENRSRGTRQRDKNSNLGRRGRVLVKRCTASQFSWTIMYVIPLEKIDMCCTPLAVGREVEGMEKITMCRTYLNIRVDRFSLLNTFSLRAKS